MKTICSVIFEHDSFHHISYQQGHFGSLLKGRAVVLVILVILIGLKFSLNDLAQFITSNKGLDIWVKQNIGRSKGPT